MPYDLLDAIEQAAIGDKLIPIECLQTNGHSFPQYDQAPAGHLGRSILPAVVPQPMETRTIRPVLPCRRQNLDPKTWCRFPILSGGYERELREMWQAVEAESDA